MSDFTPDANYSAKSAADLSTKKGYVVKLDANRKVVLSSAATDLHIGVLADGGRVSGDNCDIVLVNGPGTYKGIAGGTIAKDAWLTSDANGKLVATTTSGDRLVGRAMHSAVANQQVEYLKNDSKY